MKRKKIEWTEQQIADFWDHCSQRPNADAEYFSNQVGKGVVAFTELIQPLQGLRVLDYGCGPGYLVPFLLESGAQVVGLDQSSDSVKRANARFRGQTGWMGAYLSDQLSQIPFDCFDLVFCLETIEHLDDKGLETLFVTLGSLLSGGGMILMTTPNNENLGAATVMCPACGSEFHRWQHVRSWTVAGLKEYLRSHGLEPDFCEGVSFRAFQQSTRVRWFDHSLRSLASSFKMIVADRLDRLSPRPFPHGRVFRRIVAGHSRDNLVAIARRAGDYARN